MFRYLSKEELQQRWSRVQKLLRKNAVDAAIIANNVNVLYLTGRVFNGYCYIPQEGDPLFFVKRPIDLSGEGVLNIRKPEEMIEILLAKGVSMPQSLMLEGDQLTYNEQARLMALFNLPVVGNATLMMRQIRSIKTPYEVALMRQIGLQHVEAQRGVASLIRKGMTDVDLSREINHLYLTKGSLGVFRMFGANMEISLGGSILAGDNALNASPYDFSLGGGGVDPCLPIGCDGRMLEDGMAVMVDIGGSFGAYMTDMTRVYSIGELPEIAYRAHAFSIELHRYVQSIAKPGKMCSDIYIECFDKVQAAGLGEYFMGYGQQAAFVGHGIGMEVNELPVMFRYSKAVLEENVVFALEPKFVIPGIGAVGVENAYVVTPKGAELLTPMAEEIVQIND